MLHKINYLLLLIFVISIGSCEKKSSCPDAVHTNTLNEYPMDPYAINELEIIEDELQINVSYGGGCEDHEFKLLANKDFIIDNMEQEAIRFYLSHNANNDGCFALILEHPLCFDISDALHQNSSGEVEFYFSHPDSTYNLNIH